MRRRGNGGREDLRDGLRHDERAVVVGQDGPGPLNIGGKKRLYIGKKKKEKKTYVMSCDTMDEQLSWVKMVQVR